MRVLVVEDDAETADYICSGLRSLVASLQRLRQRLERMAAQEPPDPADTAAALSETEGIIATFNALLRIAQIEAGERRERFAPLDLNPIAQTVFEMFEPAAEDAGQSLRLTPAPGPALVSGDRDLLMQMLSNLVENALRHCPPGSRIGIGVDIAPGGAPVLSVSDTGPGIASADTDKVFRRFYRAEQSRTGKGHGLGLAMVRAIADLHGASVSLADNAPGLKCGLAFRQIGCDARPHGNQPRESRYRNKTCLADANFDTGQS